MNTLEYIYRGDEKRLSRLHTGTGVLCANPIQVSEAALTTLARVLFGYLVKKPWLVQSALPTIAERASNARIFEYGAGMSTLWFAERAKDVHSVESNAQWAERLNASLKARGHKPVALVSDPNAYARHIHSFDGLFDVILVDGINRRQCIVESVNKLRVGGLLIIDNTDIQTDLVPTALANASFSAVRYTGYAPGIFHPNETTLLTKLS